jgi:hypothetical protein
LENAPKARITTSATRPASEVAARRMHVIRMSSALRATCLQSRLRKTQHLNLLQAR